MVIQLPQVNKIPQNDTKIETLLKTRRPKLYPSTFQLHDKR